MATPENPRPNQPDTTFNTLTDMCIDMAGVVESLAKTAMTDPVTGHYNRRGFFDVGSEVIAADPEAKYQVLMGDLDNFKPINDTLGHAAGDEALRVACDEWDSHIRGNIVTARLGGDEVGALVYVRPGEPLEATIPSSVVHTIEQRWEESVNDDPRMTTIGATEQGIKLGISIGMSEVHTGVPDVGEAHKLMGRMLEEADFQMYVAKGARKRAARHRDGSE